MADGEFSVEDIKRGIAHAEEVGDVASLPGLRARLDDSVVLGFDGAQERKFVTFHVRSGHITAMEFDGVALCLATGRVCERESGHAGIHVLKPMESPL